MKKNNIVLLVLFIVGLQVAKAQEVKYTLVKPVVVNSAEIAPQQHQEQVEIPESTTNMVTTTYRVKNKEYYTKFIDALEVKKEAMKSSPYYNSKAEETGWYEKIDKEIAKARQELLKLEENEK